MDADAMIRVMGSPRLAVRTADQDGVVTVRCTGEVDLSTCDALRTALMEGVSNDARGLVVDLTGVEFLDCAGLGVLVAASAACAHDGARMTVIAGRGGAVMRLLRATGTLDLLGVRIPAAEDDGAGPAATDRAVGRTP